MTNNPTIDGVSRAKLEQALKLAAVFDDGSDGADAESAQRVAGILRAILDAPMCATCSDNGAVGNMLNAEPCPDCNAPAVERQEICGKHTGNSCATCSGTGLVGTDDECPVCSGDDVDALQSTIAQLQARIVELESGRGEPFGWVDEPYAGWIKDRSSGWATIWNTDGSGNPSRGGPSVALYTAPPAPVAVVLPERKREDQDYENSMRVYQHGVAKGWNACLDATTALNEGRK